MTNCDFQSNDLIIISGLPCTGKTTLGRKLSEHFRIPLISRDELKEALLDSLGTGDLAWSKKLGAASYKLLYRLLETQICGRCPLVIESNFYPEYDVAPLAAYIRDQSLRAIQVYCRCAPDRLIERFNARATSLERHAGHADTNRINEIGERVQKRPDYILPLDVPLIIFDTTHRFDYADVISQIVGALKSARKDSRAA